MSTDEHHLRRLYDEHFTAVQAYCLRRLPTADANEAVADVFAIAWRRLDARPPADRMRPWLYGIARNVVAHQRRGHARRRRLNAKADTVRPPASDDPDAEVVESSTVETVLREMADLPDLDREVLRLRVWEELSAAEIAEVVGLSVAATEKRIARAYRKLESRLRRLGLVDDESREAGAT